MINENFSYKLFEFEVDGYPAFAVIDGALKSFADKNRYPFAVFIEIVPKEYNHNGHVVGEEADYFEMLETALMNYFEENLDSVYVGHTTEPGKRVIIFYAKDKAPIQEVLNSWIARTERETNFEISFDENWDLVSAFYQN